MGSESESIEIPSDSEEEEEVPLAERLARKMKCGASLTSSSNSCLELELDITPPSSKVSKSGLNVEISPPPEVSPFRPSEIDRDPPQYLSRAGSSFGNSKSGRMSKEEKEQDKLKKQEEKMLKKQQKEMEKHNDKAVKLSEKVVAKQTEKSEVSKYVQVVIDPETVNCPPGNDILSTLQNPPNGKEDSKFECRVGSQPVAQSLTWRRKIVTFSIVEGEVKYHDRWHEEGRALIVISTLDLVEKIKNKSLETWAEEVKRKLDGKHVSLMIYGVMEFFKEEKNAEERVRKAKARGEKPRGRDEARLAYPVTKYDFDEAVTSLSLDRLADHYFFDKTPSKGETDRQTD